MKKNEQYLKVSSRRLGSLLSELGISQQELADKNSPDLFNTRKITLRKLALFFVCFLFGKGELICQ